MIFLSSGLFSGKTSTEEPIKPADFYKGKTITLVNSCLPSVATDLRGRLFASRLEKYTGATVVVKNMAASSLEGASYTFNAKPDGLTICAIAAGALFPHGVLGFPDPKHRLNELSYIGLINYGRCFAIWVKQESPYNSFKDLQQAKGIKLASTTPEAVLSQAAALAIDILKLDGKIVADGGVASRIPNIISSGEADCGPLNVYPGVHFAKQGIIRPLFIVGANNHEALPGVPTITDLAALSEEQKDMITAFGTMPHGTPFFGPPGIPSDRLELLREIFEKTIAEPEFRQELEEKSDSPWSGYQSGREITSGTQAMIKAQATYKTLFGLVKKYLA